MKTIQILKAVLVAGGLFTLGQPAKAAMYTFTGPGGDGIGTYTSSGTSLNQVIPDNSPVGAGYGFNFTATGLSLSAVTLTLNLSGGFNGDMYGYLQHGGTVIELFNPGSFSANGAMGSTLNLTLSSLSTTALSGANATDLAGGLTYAATGELTGFNGADPNGLWTLYFEDKSLGDQMTLNSFNLSLTASPTAVPEPANMALGVFGLLAAGGLAWKRWRSRNSEIRTK